LPRSSTRSSAKTFERSLAVDSLKLRFGTHIGPQGTHYIWIDPPWEFHSGEGLIAHSDEYTDESFHNWSQLFHPIDENILVAWETLYPDAVVFRFASGHFLVVPTDGDDREADDWYAHWYAQRRAT
jgi:hypothetical protein